MVDMEIALQNEGVLIKNFILITVITLFLSLAGAARSDSATSNIPFILDGSGNVTDFIF